MPDDFQVVLSDTRKRSTESILGIGYALLVDAARTGGAYELMKFDVPTGVGPPLHVHQNEDEAFFLVEGQLTVFVGEERVQAEPGNFVHLPRHVPHGFQNTSGRFASFLCWVMPGNLAGFFDAFKRPWPEESDRPAPVDEADVGRMMAAAATFQIEFPDAR